MKLTVGTVTKGFQDVPYWGALEQGLFAAEGLEVDLVVLGSTDLVTEGLLSGEIQIGLGSTEHVIRDVEAGGPLRAFAGNINTLMHAVVVQPDITRLGDLRGSTIGVSDLSAGTSSVLFAILESVGLVYPDDYSIVEVGAVPPRHPLLLDRTIDAALQTDPYNYMAQDAGLSSLGHVTRWFPDFQFGSLNCRKDWADDQAEVLEAFLRAALRGSAWMYADRRGVVDVAHRRTDVPVAYLDRAWDAYVSRQAIPQDLRLVRRGIEACIALMHRGRTHRFDSSVGAGPERYVEAGPLARAQKALGLPIAVLT